MKPDSTSPDVSDSSVDAPLSSPSRSEESAVRTNNWTPNTRTPADALNDILAARLRFGDLRQIDAIRIIEDAEALIGVQYECPECDGEGEVEDDEPGTCDRCGRECSHCSSEELKDCPECDGDGVCNYTRDKVYRMRPADIRLRLQTIQRLAA